MMSRREEYYAQRTKAREWVQLLTGDVEQATGKPWTIWRLEDLFPVMQERCPLPLVNRWVLSQLLIEAGFRKVSGGNGVKVAGGQYRLWVIGKLPEGLADDGGACAALYETERAA